MSNILEKDDENSYEEEGLEDIVTEMRILTNYLERRMLYYYQMGIMHDDMIMLMMLRMIKKSQMRISTNYQEGKGE